MFSQIMQVQILKCTCQGNSLKLQRGFGTIEREFQWSEAEKLPNRAEMSFMKSIGKSEFRLI